MTNRSRAVRLAVVVGVLIPLVIVGWLAVYWYFHVGPGRPETNPANQATISSGYPTPTPISPKEWFANVKWYTIEGAATLRNQSDVVNFALLKNGGVYYSVDYSVPFSPETLTKATNVYQITSETHSGTGVSFTLQGGAQYNLNVLEPFVIDPGPTSTTPPTIWVFDQSGQLWRLNVPQPASVLTPINQVKAKLPITVAANPDLSLTTGK